MTSFRRPTGPVGALPALVGFLCAGPSPAQEVKTPAGTTRAPTFVPRDRLLGAGTELFAERQATAEADLARRIAFLPKEERGAPPPGFPIKVRSLAELPAATIGFGFEVFTLPASALEGSLPLEQSVVSTGTWRFSVIAGDRPVALMTLARMGGSLRVVEVGAAKLAELLDEMTSRHAARGANGLRFIRVPSAHMDLLEVSSPGAPPRYERLTDPGVLLGSDAVRMFLR